MDDFIIRTVTADDAEKLLEIYSPYVKNTAISFEYDPPTLDEFKNRILNTLKKYPYLCILQNNRIMGYAYAGAFHPRAAFGWAAETTVYLAPDTRKCGLGRKLYEALEKALKEMGILNLYALVAYPETEDEYLTKNSAEFHAHLGYVKVGELHNCGYKFGRWYHMIYMEKIIGEHSGIPRIIGKVKAAGLQEPEFIGGEVDFD
ncbi:MAG: GNAT family N-acetyltransferase [Lachnospiraceae bacterium]|nr:GNAT family N-acetyltransferase [Lachnospiraceae bacterium]